MGGGTMIETAAAARGGRAAGTPAHGLELSDETYSRWREYVLPAADELTWQAIPWRVAYWPAVAESQRSEKPILIYAMNGHPHACT
jgi:hypothetical protein